MTLEKHKIGLEVLEDSSSNLFARVKTRGRYEPLFCFYSPLLFYKLQGIAKNLARSACEIFYKMRGMGYALWRRLGTAHGFGSFVPFARFSTKAAVQSYRSQALLSGSV